MKYLKFIDNTNYDLLNEAAILLKNGKLVLFPTETVYGIGANGLDETAVKNIFIAKGREQDNPLILHIANIQDIYNIAENISENELKIMDAFWPGPLTIILKKKSIVPNVVTAGLDTVAIRMPKNKTAHELIKRAGVPIAAPSANISGKPSGTNIQDIFDELANKVDYIIDGGPCEYGVESTVVKLDNNNLTILRPGAITKEMLENVISNVEIDKHIMGEVKEGEKVLSPGMKYKHYAPESRCILLYSDSSDKLIKKIQNTIQRYGKSVVICNSNNKACYNAYKVITYGYTKEEMCKNIFSILRQADKYTPDIIVIEGVDTNGLGLAIMNRLIRSCSHNYIEIK